MLSGGAVECLSAAQSARSGRARNGMSKKLIQRTSSVSSLSTVKDKKNFKQIDRNAMETALSLLGKQGKKSAADF